MRRLIATVSLLALSGCAYVGIGQTPTGSRFSPQSSGSGPVVIRVGTAEPAPLETPKTEEASTAEASDDPGATQ
ncbi:hypothetical protein JYJ95_00225 [Corallococcus exiguus]|uniref:hypothetical protein n=1 Tax=Corallococcus exiguus TaxID=83462 RepID=UPI001A8F3475|nr:hypothetical protein [Corallococcus exiguus]MBN8464919.1 hypothetical protein [Corallococcus exiguus]